MKIIDTSICNIKKGRNGKITISPSYHFSEYEISDEGLDELYGAYLQILSKTIREHITKGK